MIESQMKPLIEENERLKAQLALTLKK